MATGLYQILNASSRGFCFRYKLLSKITWSVTSNAKNFLIDIKQQVEMLCLLDCGGFSERKRRECREVEEGEENGEWVVRLYTEVQNRS